MASTSPAQSRPTGLARWRTVLIVGIGIFWLIFGSYLIYNQTNRWPVVSSLEQLVAPPEVLMPAIEPLTTANIPVKWGSSLAPQLFNEALLASGGAMVVVGQRVQYTLDAAIEINQLVGNTQRPANTAWEFFQAQPGAFDLQSGAQFSEITLAYRSPVADQQRAVCVLESADQCRITYIWVRYGQYLGRIRIAGADQPLTTATLSAIFQQIDQHITQKLEGLTK